MRDFRVLHKSIDEALQSCKAYEAHLNEIAPKLPEATRTFVLAPWYHNWNHHDCPHDSWLMDFTLKAAVKNDEDRTLDLTLNLLGAYHDRILTFNYRNVTLCGFEIQKQRRQNTGDWLYDEFDVFEYGFVSHEVLWQFGKPWKIISERVEFSAENRPQNESCTTRS